MIEALGVHIAAKVSGVSLTIGTDFFIDFLAEEEPDIASAIFQTGGISNFYNPELSHFTVQVKSRAFDKSTAQARAEAIFDVLHGVSAGGFTLTSPLSGGQQWFLNVAQSTGGPPQRIGQDARGRHVYVSNHSLHMEQL